MEKIETILSKKFQNAFKAAGYDEMFGRVRRSDRPDLCEFQCSGAMSAARNYHKAPLAIAQDVLKKAEEGNKDKSFFEAVIAAPGFININISGEFLASYIMEMDEDKFLSIPQTENP